MASVRAVRPLVVRRGAHHTEQEGRYEDDLECGEIEVKGLREAELVNHILAAALRYDLSIGDCDALVLGEVDIVARQERLIGLSWSVCRVKARINSEL